MQSYSFRAEQRAKQVNGNLTKQVPSSRFHRRGWDLDRDLLSLLFGHCSLLMFHVLSCSLANDGNHSINS